jgi:hypothetical protein
LLDSPRSPQPGLPGALCTRPTTFTPRAGQLVRGDRKAYEATSAPRVQPANEGARGPAAAVSEPSTSSTDAASAGEDHYFYNGDDLGTVSQHEQFCRTLSEHLDEDGSLAKDQDRLESEGCRGGGLIASP